MAEAGIADYEASLWLAVVAPANTPPAIVTRLNREMVDVLNTAQVKSGLAAQGLEVEPGPPDALATRIRADIDKWRKVITEAGIRAE
jgi:tripartite-type tricarboxylate transporter receptor subunit TctC